ncbi:rifin [Plasmodium reichenowi]|uniref:Rifin n=1 Tax=Plasmodium reichenowi TaxID=5854 RepID=A0A060RLV8_PLARE|nr:rifin [Plasmodium reichenowi]
MKVHYINILLFALPLNILLYNQRNHTITTPHTHHPPTTRLLCECDIYEPANYDSDPQMKSVMENFNRQTSQRFHEYDERMIEKRKQCKERCDKEIQKIILKDKLEKQMAEQLTTLETKIDTNDIPTCVCEKSLADKVEKGCLRCGSVLGGGIAPSVGLLGGLGIYGWKMGLPEAAAKAAAIAAGKAAGEAAGLKVGNNALIEALKLFDVDTIFPQIFNSIGTTTRYNETSKIAGAIIEEYNKICVWGGPTDAQLIKFKYGVGILIKDEDIGGIITQKAEKAVPEFMESLIKGIKTSAENKATQVTATKTAELQETYMAAVESTYTSFQTTIIASIVAIVVIVLIMVIIYLILRYRRKKKMKKKLQYIKLLEE